MEILFLVNSVTAKFAVFARLRCVPVVDRRAEPWIVRLQFFRNASMVFDSSFLCIPGLGQGILVICVTQMPRTLLPHFFIPIKF